MFLIFFILEMHFRTFVLSSQTVLGKCIAEEDKFFIRRKRVLYFEIKFLSPVH